MNFISLFTINKDHTTKCSSNTQQSLTNECIVVNKGYGAREITDLIFIFLFVSLFPLEIVLEDADAFLMPQGYVKLNIPILPLSSLQCKRNNSIISCQELRCITVTALFVDIGERFVTKSDSQPNTRVLCPLRDLNITRKCVKSKL